MRTRLWLASVLALAVAGCGGGTANPPRNDLWRGSDVVPGVDPNFVYRIQPGAGIAGVVPGVDVGYFITANVGNSFRLVWTGDAANSGTRRRFQGSVYTTGAFSQIVTGCNGGFCGLETDDLVSTVKAIGGGQRVDFDTIAADGLDGFDFVTSTSPVFFDVLVEGQRRADLVFFPATDNGGQVSNSGGMPFGLIPQ